MFTGLVQDVAQVKAIERQGSGARISLKNIWREDVLQLGESIAINGCCLSVAQLKGDDDVIFDVSSETLIRTNLGRLESGSLVNTERALRASDRLGGHMVSGHVDCTGLLKRFDWQGSEGVLEISFAKEFSHLVIPKGSIAIDGISLTINSIADASAETSIGMMIIPTTASHTTLSKLRPGWLVNLEFDLVAKYLERFAYCRKE